MTRLNARSAMLVLATLAGAAAAPTVSATPPTPASGAAWPQNLSVDYRWKEGNEPPAWLRGAVNSAAQEAVDSSRAQTPVFDYRNGGPGWISYTADIPTSYAVGYAIRNVPTSYGIRLRPQGYVLDWGTLRWCQFYENPPNGCYDAELIALHEFGHVLTLDHADDDLVTDWLDTVMHWAPKTKSKVGWNAHEFGRCDVARLQLRYEARSPSALISTCLELATTLTLTASPPWAVTLGSSVTLSAALRIDPESAADILAGDPLTGRTVWLQRRVVGGSGWSDLAIMAPALDSAGRYVKSVNVSAPYEYRARFDGPSNEGLGGATSSMVRVSAADPCVKSDLPNSINIPLC